MAEPSATRASVRIPIGLLWMSRLMPTTIPAMVAPASVSRCCFSQLSENFMPPPLR